jgi:hypothetical protein
LSKLGTYLDDPFLKLLYGEIRKAGPLRSISLDITKDCNLRCTGCYYFEEGMDQVVNGDESAFDALLDSEQERRTNFITIVGGEPSLVPTRIRKIYDRFHTNVATNGLVRIPLDGLENLPIGVSLWGASSTDSFLRGNGKRDLFSIGLDHYYQDARAFFYYTVTPGNAYEVEEVVDRIVQNGNRVLFNYYSDLTGAGGKLDHRSGFEMVKHEIDRMIDKYPDKILMSSYFNQIVSTNELAGESWGYDVCTNLSTNLASNQERFRNGNPYNPHFRAYNADFSSTRRCCTGISRSCESCFDTWEHFSWIMINMKKHLSTKESFAQWLTTMYLFYFINNLVSSDGPGLEEVHAYLAKLSFSNSFDSLV